MVPWAPPEPGGPPLTPGAPALCLLPRALPVHIKSDGEQGVPNIAIYNMLVAVFSVNPLSGGGLGSCPWNFSLTVLLCFRD